MAYTHNVDPRRRAISVGTVAAVHLALGAAFVLGLAPGLITADKGGGITTRIVPPEAEPAPPPPPIAEDEPARTLVLTAPIPLAKVPTTDRPPVLPSTDTTPVLPTTGAGLPDWTPAPPPPLPIPAPKPLPKSEPTALATAPALRDIGFGNEAYPDAARRAGESGTTRVTLTIDANGRASACAVTGSSGSYSLDEAACQMVRRHSRFSPAKDTAGKAVARTMTLPITWRLPN